MWEKKTPKYNIKLITIDIGILFSYKLLHSSAKCSLLFEMKTLPFATKIRRNEFFGFLLLYSKVVIIHFMRYFVVLFAVCIWVLVTQTDWCLEILRWEKHKCNGREKKKVYQSNFVWWIDNNTQTIVLHCHLVAFRTQNSSCELFFVFENVAMKHTTKAKKKEKKT